MRYSVSLFDFDAFHYADRIETKEVCTGSEILSHLKLWCDAKGVRMSDFVLPTQLKERRLLKDSYRMCNMKDGHYLKIYNMIYDD